MCDSGSLTSFPGLSYFDFILQTCWLSRIYNSAFNFLRWCHLYLVILNKESQENQPVLLSHIDDCMERSSKLCNLHSLQFWGHAVPSMIEYDDGSHTEGWLISAHWNTSYGGSVVFCYNVCSFLKGSILSALSFSVKDGEPLTPLSLVLSYT